MEITKDNSSLKFEITAKRLYAAQPKSSLTVWLINFRFGILRHLSKINLAMYVFAMTSLKEAMEYGIPFSFIITFATFCDANDAL